MAHHKQTATTQVVCVAAVAWCVGVATAVPLTGGRLEPPARDGPVHKLSHGFGSTVETKEADVDVEVAALKASAASSSSSLQWVEDGITHSGVVTVVCERCVLCV